MESAGDENRAKGRKVWNRSGPDLAKHVFGLFSHKFTAKVYLTNAFKSFFRDDSFKQCSNIVGFLRVLGGRAHTCARACASEKLRTTRFGTCRVLRTTRFGTCRVPYNEALVRASGKDLAQGQSALLDPT